MLDETPSWLHPPSLPLWVTLAGNLEGWWGDYSRKAVILNISDKGGDYSRKAINRGTAIIRGYKVFIP